MTYVSFSVWGFCLSTCLNWWLTKILFAPLSKTMHAYELLRRNIPVTAVGSLTASPCPMAKTLPTLPLLVFRAFGKAFLKCPIFPQPYQDRLAPSISGQGDLLGWRFTEAGCMPFLVGVVIMHFTTRADAVKVAHLAFRKGSSILPRWRWISHGSGNVNNHHFLFGWFFFLL